MGKFGKPNHVKLSPLDYNICILGEGKIGKTTLMKQVCEKLVGPEGYMHFDVGREEGRYAIEGIVSEPIEDWAKLEEVVDDIVVNKNVDYPELKVVIWDTLDELVSILEAEAIRKWNVKNPDKRADSINQAWGGFGKGSDKAIDMFLEKMHELKNVGVSSIIVGHVKRSDIVDPTTQETYSKLTADTTQRYFNSIKNKMHFIGLAYIDRDIVKEKTGRKNIATKQDITINKVAGETRVISFRDDSYSVDSGSRFADIVDKIPFDCDAFIEALQNAILAEQAKGTRTLEEAQKEQTEYEAGKVEKAKEYSDKAKLQKEYEKYEENRDEYISIIRAAASGSQEDKAKAKTELAKRGITKISDPEVPIQDLKAVADMFS